VGTVHVVLPTDVNLTENDPAAAAGKPFHPIRIEFPVPAGMFSVVVDDMFVMTPST
jgi:hypothetical protein